MHNFKKAILRVLAFVLIFLILCTPSLFVYYKYCSSNNNLLPELEQQNGKIDTLFCGASQSVWGFVPAVMDENAGCNSFNISSGLLSMEGRYTILKEVIANNPVKTVILDLSYGGLERTRKTDSAEGVLLLSEHLKGWSRAKYLLTHIAVDDIFYAYYYMFRTGTYTLLTRSFGAGNTDSPYYGKGYWTTDRVEDQSGSIWWKKGETIPRVEYNPSKETLDYLDQIMQLCKDNHIQVYLVTTPYPTRVVSWVERDGMLDAHTSLAEQYDCVLYDLNLYKEKDARLSDATSYFDEEHLSQEGAIITTEILADLVANKDPGIKKSDLFYNSYGEYIEHYLTNVE